MKPEKPVKVQWQLLARGGEAATQWDEALLQSQDYTVFQSFGWGEYKRGYGWHPWRWIARNEKGAVVAMAQILVKSLPAKIKIGWAPGAPVLLFSDTPVRDIAGIINSLLKVIVRRHRRISLRFDSYLPSKAEHTYALSQWLHRPFIPLNTGYSTALDLSQPYDVLLRNIKPRHRSYVRQALKQDIEWRVGCDARQVQDFVQLHNEMTQHKNLHGLRTSQEDIAALVQALGQSVTFFNGYMHNEPVTSYLILRFGQKAFYLLAATGEQGRKRHASYALMDQLVQHLQQQGITQFDLGGLDPRSPSAAGVNQFKRGFGGELVQYLGEWEWASQEWLRWVLNFGIWYRGSQL